MPLVINSLGGQTHTHIDIADKNNFKKLNAHLVLKVHLYGEYW